MTSEEHKQRHIELHRYFDELLADWINHTNGLPSTATVLDLMEWSHSQTIEPTGIEAMRAAWTSKRR